MLSDTEKGRLGRSSMFNIPVHGNGIFHQFPTHAEMTSYLS